MKVLNPLVDVVLFSDNTIQARKLFGGGEVVAIEGEDVGGLVKMLPVIYERGIDTQSAISLLQGRYSAHQINEVLDLLESVEFLTESDDLGFSTDFLEPLSFQELLNNHWAVRKDNDVFIIFARSEMEAKELFFSIARRWKSEDDFKYLSLLGEGNEKYQIFSSRAINLKNLKHFLLEKLGEKENHFSERFLNIRLLWNGNGFDMNLVERMADILNSTNKDCYWMKTLSKVLNHPFLISETTKFKQSSDDPFSLEIAAFSASHGLNCFGGQAFSDVQLGRGETAAEACGKAVMEALERYCGRIPVSCMEGFFSTAGAIGHGKYLNPSLLVNYVDKQYEMENFPVKPFKDGEEYHWVLMKKEDMEISVPSEFVYYSHTSNSFTDGRALFWSSSNGVAAHFNVKDAIKGAVCELIERDAIMIWWLNRESPPLIDHNVFSGRIGKMISIMEKLGYQIEILDLTLDLFPVALAVARNRKKEYPYFFCGAACNSNFFVAAEKAILELELSIWSAFKNKTNRRIDDPRILYEPMDHEIYYLDPCRSMELDFLFKGSVIDNLKETESGDVEIGKYLKSKGFELYHKDITAKEIVELNTGISVVRVLVPGLIPITFGFMSEPLGMSRIYEILVNLGLRKNEITLDEIIDNYQPHLNVT
jgi:ribosomal protein S12 methylthiotransferase accessory factor